MTSRYAADCRSQATVGGGRPDPAEDRAVPDYRHPPRRGARPDQASARGLVGAQGVMNGALGPPLEPPQHGHYHGARVVIPGR